MKWLQRAMLGLISPSPLRRPQKPRRCPRTAGVKRSQPRSGLAPLRNMCLPIQFQLRHPQGRTGKGDIACSCPGKSQQQVRINGKGTVSYRIIENAMLKKIKAWPNTSSSPSICLVIVQSYSGIEQSDPWPALTFIVAVSPILWLKFG